MKVYLSSTFKDLHKHRSSVAKALAKAGYHVIRMEDYPARAMHTKAACQSDVAECNIYLGIFAWRYGYVPDDDNPERKSITELEYEAAEPAKRLLFLLKDEAKWPPESRDADPERIRALRARALTKISAYFSNVSELTTEVLAALLYKELAKPIGDLTSVQTFELGPSYINNLREKIANVKSATLLKVHLGEIPWWNTRLHLVASMLRDFTGVKEIIFCDGDRFLTMATPMDVRIRLAEREPGLDAAYLQFKQRLGPAPSAQRMDETLIYYPQIVSECFGWRAEEVIKEDVDAGQLRKGLDLTPEASRIELNGQPPTVLQRDIIRCATPYVVLECGGTCDSVIDRVALTTRIADNVMTQRA
jgi:Domain of unknown function (DUF4062)